MLLLFLLIIFTIVLYFARKFGYLDIIICLLLTIIAFGTYMPDTLKHYIFFQLHLNEVLSGIPTEIMNSEKIKALSNVNNINLGQALSNLTNNLVDVLSQKPIDTTEQLQEQTKILTNIEQKLEVANTINEVALEQYSIGQNIELQKLASINNAIDTQTKELKVVVNNPIGVLDSLNSINSNLKPNIRMLGELNEINYKIGQENKILIEGFNKLLQADGKINLGKELQTLSVNLDKKLALHQDNISQTLESLNQQYNLDRQETRKLMETVQHASIAEIELAYEEAEKKIQAAETMANYYRKHEVLGENNSIPKGTNVVNSNINPVAAGVGAVSVLTWVLKFLRIV